MCRWGNGGRRRRGEERVVRERGRKRKKGERGRISEIALEKPYRDERCRPILPGTRVGRIVLRGTMNSA